MQDGPLSYALIWPLATPMHSRSVCCCPRLLTRSATTASPSFTSLHFLREKATPPPLQSSHPLAPSLAARRHQSRPSPAPTDEAASPHSLPPLIPSLQMNSGFQEGKGGTA
jgi:hypothetical protein